MAIKDHWRNWIFPLLKLLGGALFAIPTIIALIDIFTFGVSFNNSTISPLLKPRIECRNTKVQGVTEGGYPIYDVAVKGNLPHYLRPGVRSISLPYRMTFESKDEFTFDGTVEPLLPPNFIKIENRYSSAAHIVKSLHYMHRFIDEDSFTLKFRIIGPQFLLGDVCPFDFSVRF